MTDQCSNVYTPALGRSVMLRDVGSDHQVWADTFTGLYHVNEQIGTPKTVLDLGANIGLTAAHYKTLWPDALVVAVEMDNDNAALAEINAPDVEVRHYAVSSAAGWGSYNPMQLPEAFAFTRDDKGGRAVIAHTLRAIITGEFGGHVDFVKMDVEGEEWALFASPDWVPMVDVLLVELHRGDVSSEEMVKLACGQLVEAGFRSAYWTGHHPQAVIAFR